MAKRKLGGLGKGLDSLFEDLPMTEDASPDLTRLPVREIEPDPDQPRKNFDEDAMAALAESIGENGLLQPIAVRAKKTGPGYVIIAGERRWRAARMAGLDEVPVLIKDVTDEQAAALALIENLQREDLDPIEVAEGCKKLIERYGLTQEEAAKRLGKSRSAITNAMRLLNLPEYVRDQVRTGDISAGHAKSAVKPWLTGADVRRGGPDHCQGHERAPGRSFVPQNVQAAEARQGRGCLYPPGACRGGGGCPERDHRQRSACGLQGRQGRAAHCILF